MQESKREEDIPWWIRIFGGAIISITFLCTITVVGYIINNLNSLQNQINAITLECVSLNKEVATQKEKLSAYDSKQIILIEENKQFVKDLQSLRERFAAFEGKIQGKISEEK